MVFLILTFFTIKEEPMMMTTGVRESSDKQRISNMAKELGITIPKGKLPLLAKAYEKLTDRGVSFNGAKASFHLWLLHSLGAFADPYKLERRRIIYERLKGEANSEAVLAIRFNGDEKKEVFVSNGDGHIDALKNVLRQALCGRYPVLTNVRTTDFSLRTLSMKKGSAMLVRVYCRFSDGKKSWKTIGVNKDSVDAAWEALWDGYLYKIATA
jgi:2-isopropylmalate synthase